MKDSNTFDKLSTSKDLNQTEEIPQTGLIPENTRRKLLFIPFGWIVGITVVGAISSVIIVAYLLIKGDIQSSLPVEKQFKILQKKLPSPSPVSNSLILPNIPNAKILSNGGYHIFQSFNNCGPAALSMALRFYGINVSQEELGQDLRPYQVPGGDNDDKSVTLDEVAEKSKDFGFTPYLRPMGNDQILKQFIANDIPVIARTWTKPNEDIGHFRVIKGYDDSKGVFIQDDSLQGKNLEYTYADFNEIWKKFNYEYLVLVPKDKIKTAEQIIGEDVNEKTAWEKAKNNSLKELASDPDDTDARFNLSVAYYKLGDYQKSVDEYEKVEDKLSFRTLWYQIEPILSYYELGNDARVFQITEKVLNNQNRAFSELYVIRGKIYQRQGNNFAAQQEFEKAVMYNKSLKEAQKLLAETN